MNSKNKRLNSFIDRYDSYLIFLVIVFSFIAFLYPAATLTKLIGGDESLYLYFSELVSEGQVPYRDFFFAHPPLFILFYGFFMSILGPSLFFIKFATFTIALANLFLLFFISKELYGKYYALIPTSIFAFLDTTRMNFAFFAGSNLPVFFILLSIILLVKRKDSPNLFYYVGFLLSIASLARLNSAVFLLALIIYLLIKKSYRDIVKLVFSFSLIFGIVSLYYFSISNGKFIYDVFLYHTAKSSQENFATFTNVSPANLFNLILSRTSSILLLIISVTSVAFVFLRKRMKSLDGLFSISFLSFLAFNLLTYGHFTWYKNFLNIFMFLLSAIFFKELLSNSKNEITKIFVFSIVIIMFLAAVGEQPYNFMEDSHAKRVMEIIGPRIGENETFLTFEYGPGAGAAFLGNFSIPPDLVDINNLREEMRDMTAEKLKRYVERYNIRYIMWIKDPEAVMDFCESNCREIATVSGAKIFEVNIAE